MRGDERRGRRVAAVADGDSTTGVHVLMERVCRLVVDEMTLSGARWLSCPERNRRDRRANGCKPVQRACPAARYGVPEGVLLYSLAQDVVERRVRFDE